jgi:hypothetical protein
MNRFSSLLSVAAVFVASVALADNPGQGKGGKGRDSARDSGGISLSVEIHDSQRAIIREYYGAQFARGACPPGLAKKNNGCMPPGQAKQWMRGKALPRSVVFHELPAHLVARLNTPAGARYVRVAADILLIAVGTGMVLDAIEDLHRL